MRSVGKLKFFLLGFAVTMSMVVWVAGNSQGPPLEVTGDFGQPSCNQSGCHEGNPVNASGGSLVIAGPAAYEPGRTYPITVTLNRSGQSRWGFELSARVAATGAQVGNLIVTNSNLTQVRSEAGIQYASHNANLASTFPGTAGPASWTFNWIAPATAVGVIRFSCAGNAANNNQVNTGDFIYTTTLTANSQLNQPITAHFSQVAVAGGYSTVFTLINTGDSLLTGNLILTDQQGRPFEVVMSGDVEGMGASFPVNVPPSAIRIFVAGPLGFETTAASPRSGWGRVESIGGNLAGVGTFRFEQSGSLKAAAAVLSSPLAEVATIPVDNLESKARFTGFAVVNSTAENLNIRVVVLDNEGKVVTTIRPTNPNPLGPGGQIARFLHEFSDSFRTFRGLMVLVEDQGKKFAAVGLLFEGEVFTAIPVVTQKPPAVP